MCEATAPCRRRRACVLNSVSAEASVGDLPGGSTLESHHQAMFITSVLASAPTTPSALHADRPLLDEEDLAPAAFLARYDGQTLESYRADLRQYFQWIDEVALAPLMPTCVRIELVAPERTTRTCLVHDRLALRPRTGPGHRRDHPQSPAGRTVLRAVGTALHPRRSAGRPQLRRR